MKDYNKAMEELTPNEWKRVYLGSQELQKRVKSSYEEITKSLIISLIEDFGEGVSKYRINFNDDNNKVYFLRHMRFYRYFKEFMKRQFLFSLSDYEIVYPYIEDYERFIDYTSDEINYDSLRKKLMKGIGKIEKVFNEYLSKFWTYTDNELYEHFYENYRITQLDRNILIDDDLKIRFYVPTDNNDAYLSSETSIKVNDESYTSCFWCSRAWIEGEIEIQYDKYSEPICPFCKSVGGLVDIPKERFDELSKKEINQ